LPALGAQSGKTCLVPYDAMAWADGTRIPSMHGRSHRFQSLGHDPVLGFIFGVMDILRGTITGFSYDHLRGRHTRLHTPVAGAEPVDLITAILGHFSHLISDVATPMCRTAAQIERWMYLEGYDLRHFNVTGVELLEPICRRLTCGAGRSGVRHGRRARPATWAGR
jgi:hypothetical protein